MTRRRLLAAGGASVAALAFAELEGLLPVLGGGGPPPLHRSVFAARVGERFRLRTSSGASADVRLARVEDYGNGTIPDAVGSDAAFVLTFHAAPDVPQLEQDVMAVSHPRMRSYRLLLAPAGLGRAGQDYVAVIDTRTPPRRHHGRRAVPR